MERERSAEENDQLSRSTKKMKRIGESGLSIEATDNMELESPTRQIIERDARNPPEAGHPPSYRDTLQRNNPNITFETRDNPIWVAEEQEYLSEDDEPDEDEDHLCPHNSINSGREEGTLRTMEECFNHSYVRQRDWLPPTQKTPEDEMGFKGRFLPN